MSDAKGFPPVLSGEKKYEQKQLLPFCSPTSHISHVLLVTCQTKINQQVRFFTFDKFFLLEGSADRVRFQRQTKSVGLASPTVDIWVWVCDTEVAQLRDGFLFLTCCE